MSDSIWTATLASFRDRVAGLDPVPAGVSAAAVTATLGLGLLTKVLEIASKRKDFAGDRRVVADLVHEARNKSQILAHLADADIAAFHEYLAARRRKESTAGALRKVIEVPLGVARAAASGVTLCEKSSGLIHAAVAPDLATAKALLAAAAQSSLFTLRANLQELADDDPYRAEVAAETSKLLQNISAHGLDNP
jgi:formiminotetrahydrofolate cyclodeaminase